jgi:hypothetical protein
LFGAEPRLDYERVLRDFSGRRVNLQAPEASLLLLKPTGHVPHEGGVRLSVGSREFQLLRDWIAQGAPWDQAGLSPLRRLKVTPQSHTAKPGECYSLKVEATFEDGSVEDVTGLCVFESRNPAVAEVDRNGQVQVISPGDAALVVRYGAEPVIAMLLAPGEMKRAFPDVKEHNFIDRHILDKLRRLGIPPAELCDDATFLRRVSLDVTGALPTPQEIRAFLESKDPDKRSKKIEELLSRPGYAALWATKFCDLLRPRISYDDFGRTPAPASVRRFHDWIRARLEENIPYDEFAARILLATSLEGRSRQEWIEETIKLAEEEKNRGKPWTLYRQRKTLDLYWHRYNATGVKGAIQVAHAFLGLRLQCAECHRHPHDVWTQDDLLSFANFFNRLRTNTGVLTVQEAKKVTQLAGSGLTAEERKELMARLGKDGAKIVKLLDVSAVYHTKGNPFGWASVTSTLGTQKSEHFRLLGEKENLQVPDEQDPRELVVAWLRRPDNPFFARAIVNRVWGHYFGRGLVEPVDDMSRLNAPSHPELLEELCRSFIASKYDLKWLHRAILNSRTYQQSSRPHPDNRGEWGNYASFYPRRLPAEVLLDAINHATGTSEKYGIGPSSLIPNGTPVLEVPGRITDGFVTNILVEHAFTVFGKPQRSAETICDCERENLPTLEQALFIANHPEVIKKITDPKNRIAQIIKEHSDPARQVEELYLWTLSRRPTDRELQLCLDHLAKAGSAQKGLQTLLWSLLNSSAFLLIQ